MQDVSRRNSFPALAIGIFCLLLMLQSCNGTATRQPGTQPSVSTQQGQGQDSEVLAAQAAHDSSGQLKAEVTVTAPVVKILPEDREGLMHQKFLIAISNGSTVLIAHDISKAPEVPIKPGDVVRIHGEYIWNRKGGLIHWTHRSTTPRHEGGFIEFNGQRYQ